MHNRHRAVCAAKVYHLIQGIQSHITQRQLFPWFKRRVSQYVYVRVNAVLSPLCAVTMRWERRSPR